MRKAANEKVFPSPTQATILCCVSLIRRFSVHHDAAKQAAEAIALDGDSQATATAGASAGDVKSSKLDTENGEGGDAEPSDEEGTLRFLWAPRRMDGKPIVADADVNGNGGGDSGESGDEASAPLITFALLHHRQAFTDAGGMTGVGVPTLYGQVLCVSVIGSAPVARSGGAQRFVTRDSERGRQTPGVGRAPEFTIIHRQSLLA